MTVRKLLWFAWAASAVVVLAGAVAHRIATTPVVASLRLVPGDTVSLETTRLLAGPIQLSMQFDARGGVPRAAHGEWTSSGRAPAFERPGEPVVVRVAGAGRSVDYHAYPSSATNSLTVHRNLYPIPSGADSALPWPPAIGEAVEVPRGRTPFTVTVVDAGPSLHGETASLVVAPPLSFKATQPGYGALWWFFAWPVYVLLLVVAGVALLAETRQGRRKVGGS